MNTQHRPYRFAFASIAGALFLALAAFSGCGGSNDSTGTGGSNGGGTGGSNVDCSGSNSGDQVIASNCAISGCHNTSSAVVLAAALDLTINSTIGTRLVGVTSPGKGNSSCGGNTEPYLVAGSNPAKGLLLDKISTSPPCGLPMPETGPPLTADQKQCIIEWATTLTSK